MWAAPIFGTGRKNRMPGFGATGSLANVKLNQRIHELNEVRSLFIHPGMGDEGLAVGAAFAVNAALDEGPGNGVVRLVQRLADVYFGPSFGDREIESAISEQGLQANTFCDN